MDDPRLEQMRRSAQPAVESARDKPVDVSVLTAEDWDAARKALGPGSRSLLFGTSTKVLDTVAQRFKQQASVPVPSSQSNQESNELADALAWSFNVHESGSYSIHTVPTRLKRVLPEYVDMDYDEKTVTFRVPQSKLRTTDDMRGILRIVAEGVEELAEEIERVESEVEPPST